MRDRLLCELEGLGSADEAAIWAQRSLAAKNRLTNENARQIEEAFGSRLAGLAASTVLPAVGPPRNADPVTTQTGDRPELTDQALIAPTTQTPKTQSTEAPATGPRRGGKRRRTSVLPPKTRTPANAGIDKSVLAVPEPRRIRDREHIRHVSRQPCLVCGRTPSDAHHLRFTQAMALGRKVSDQFTVPLCRGHHRELHRSGDEAAWWGKLNIDPTITARQLWLDTHPLAFGRESEGLEDANNSANVNDKQALL